MAKVFESNNKDFVRMEGDPRYTLYSRFLLNTDAAELTFSTLGLPVKISGDNYEPCFAGEEDEAAAFLVEFQNYTIPAGETSQRKVPGIQHGPAVVSVEGLPDNDPRGAAYDKVQLVAQFALYSPKIRVADNTDNQFIEPIV